MTVPAERQRKLLVLSLYTGIGLHDLGLERTGAMRVVGQVEWDSYCSAVLEKHWPGLPRWADVRHVTTESIHDRCGRIDVITGGFSCKDVSVAGRGKGIGKETESGITWRNMFRLIRGLRPLGLVIENVPRLRTLAADRVLAALERIGYACWPVVVGAEHLGAPHRRHRVWIVAYSARNDGDGSHRETWRRWGTASAGAGSVAHAESCGRQAEGQRRQSSLAWAGSDGAFESLANAAGIGEREPTDKAVAVASRRNTWNQLGGCGIPRVGICPARCFDRMADTSGAGLEIGRTCTGSAIAQQPVSAGGGGYSWPARPGEQQFEWEAPRLVESGLGSSTPGSAGRLAGFARRNALRALGNGNPPQVAEVVGRAFLHLLQQVQAVSA